MNFLEITLLEVPSMDMKGDIIPSEKTISCIIPVHLIAGISERLEGENSLTTVTDAYENIYLAQDPFRETLAKLELLDCKIK